jgi:cell division protease FtsH
MGGMGGPMDLQKSGARVAMVPETGISFKDVAGVDGAKLELMEVVEFLKESERFTELGAKIPRGVILEGPPGTGKTLLARAVAGEAGVPFFSISGSEFVEMFVGVGASRVRDLFSNAKKNAPCIIFIDEIDAVGRQRGAGIAGGNDEREQTLNQMLTEMDGFEGNSGVIVIAATNRADVLDNALLRPGRFDRRIMVDLPDFGGRASILGVHSRGKPLAKDVDLDQIARRTPGFSGASLQNLLNEAAIFTARRKKTEIGQEEIEDALDRITIGAEKKNAVISDQRKELVAFHEAGHAVVGALTPDYDHVAKITILPRGGAGGLTFFAPNEDRVDSGLYSRQFLEGQLAVALGGRLAEEIVFGDEQVTTGASNDLQRVTQVARQMVTRMGMSKEIGQLVVESGGGGNPFLGRQMAAPPPSVSSETKSKVDAEVNRLVAVAYTRAKKCLIDNRELLDKLAKMLVERETVSADDFQRLISETKTTMMPYSQYLEAA